MNGDMGAMLESILSDPRQMEKIAEMARGLMGETGTEKKETGEHAAAQEVMGTAGAEAGLFSALGKMLGGKPRESRSTALLMAMRPYMRPEKQEKLDRALKITRIVHVAGAVMKEYGGDFLGV